MSDTNSSLLVGLHTHHGIIAEVTGGGDAITLSGLRLIRAPFCRLTLTVTSAAELRRRLDAVNGRQPKAAARTQTEPQHGDAVLLEESAGRYLTWTVDQVTDEGVQLSRENTTKVVSSRYFWTVYRGTRKSSEQVRS